MAASAGAAEKQGEAYVWGTGDAGQLGLGEDIFELARPRLLSSLPNAVPVLKVVCGGMHTLAIVQGGLVYSWGVNDEGALGRAASKEVEGAECTPGLVTIPSMGAAAVDISTGDSHVAVATSDGGVWAWGTFRTSSGLWAFTPTVQIARSPARVYVADTAADRVVAVSSGTDHVIALTAGGDVLSWGCGEKGRLGRLAKGDADNTDKRDEEAKKKLLVPRKVPNLPPSTAVVAGSYHSFAVAATADGSSSEVHAWGLNSYGQLGLPYDLSKPASDQLQYFPMRVAEMCGRGIVAGDGGEAHTVMLTAKGKVLTCGRSAYGRLGLASIDPSDDEPHSALCEVTGIAGRAVAVTAGSSTTGCVTDSGEAFVWGYGDLGQLGRGDDQSDAMTPEKINPTKSMGGKRVAALSFGGQHAALLALPSTTGQSGPAAKRAR